MVGECVVGPREGIEAIGVGSPVDLSTPQFNSVYYINF